MRIINACFGVLVALAATGIYVTSLFHRLPRETWLIFGAGVVIVHLVSAAAGYLIARAREPVYEVTADRALVERVR